MKNQIESTPKAPVTLACVYRTMDDKGNRAPVIPPNYVALRPGATLQPGDLLPMGDQWVEIQHTLGAKVVAYTNYIRRHRINPLVLKA